ncbi:hypothetical protein UPYG_G00176480 [Umbra pygmaea]|uniref:Uncharacterized protein n=1 Tax=Umbra pygmaea TaxID=75934 RepID=A0ABD0WPT6_UMBPY
MGGLGEVAISNFSGGRLSILKSKVHHYEASKNFRGILSNQWFSKLCHCSSHLALFLRRSQCLPPLMCTFKDL